MPVTFTDDQFALMGQFLRTEEHDIALLDGAIATTTENRNLVQLEHDLYANMKLDALEKQNTLLLTMVAALDLSDPDFVHELEYLSGHPSLGGTVPANWQISHVDELMATIVDRTHVDATAAILAAEAQWNTFQDLRVNILYGTGPRLTALISNVIQLTAQRAAVVARNEYLREIP